MEHLNLSRQFQQVGIRTRTGAAAIEFAILLIFLLIIVGGVVEFGRALWYYNALAKATRDGARSLSMASKTTIATVGVPQARNLVVNSANQAGVSPALTNSNVVVYCLNSSYQTVACQDGTAPANVRVGIVDFNMTIGEWMPLFVQSGGTTSYARVFTPFTVMRYML